MAAVGRFRTFSEFCRMLNFMYECAFTEAERSGRERKATEALRTERERCTEKQTRRREKAAGWEQPLWNKISKPMLRKTFQ